jgi:DNA-binding IclR family transcriptional regulator
VQSVEVAVRILEAIAENDGPIRVTALARRLELTKPRVCRHLATLTDLGLVEKAESDGYTFGAKLVHLGRAAVRDRSLSELAKPALVRLRDAVGQTVILAVPAADGATVVLCAESQQAASIAVRPGTRLQYPNSPSARLAMALQTSRGPARAPVLASLKRLQEIGADFESDALGTGIGGTAVPVFDAGRKLAAVISIVTPTRAITPQPPAEWVRALRRCAQEVEDALGGA